MTCSIKEQRGAVIHHFYHIMRAFRQFGASEDMRELTMLQMQALFTIKKQQRLMVRQLAEALCITPSSASLLADRLVTTGWLVRVNDETDRRVIYLQLTDKIKERFGKMFRHKMNHLDKIFSRFDQAELTQFNQLLNKLESALDYKETDVTPV